MCALLIDRAKARTSGRKRVEADMNRQPPPSESLEEVLRKEDGAYPSSRLQELLEPVGWAA